MPSTGPDVNYHLLRVRVKKQWFYKLQELAMEETHNTGEYTTVSDLVRSAIFDWLNVHDATRRLEWLNDGAKKTFKPSGLAIPSALIEPLLNPDVEVEFDEDEDETPEDDFSEE
jgi:Arc/MetJ-type ribon-helix-helix transcriptional regulator